MTTCIYDKTDKGREEIATRKYQIPARMRTLLVLIDGKRPLEWLLSSVAGLGLSQQNIEELLSQQFIRQVSGGAALAGAGMGALNDVSEAAPASARARALARQSERIASAQAAPEKEMPVVEAHSPAAAPAPAAAADPAAEQSRAVYSFYNVHIKASLGLRGVMLQLKVEKAAGIDDLRALRQAFLQAVIKAKGADAAIALRDELDGLLGGAPEVDDVVMPEAGTAPRGMLDFFNNAGGAVEY